MDFQMEARLLATDEYIRAVVRRAPLAQVARTFMHWRSVCFFYDPLICEQPGMQHAAHWHHPAQRAAAGPSPTRGRRTSARLATSTTW